MAEMMARAAGGPNANPFKNDPHAGRLAELLGRLPEPQTEGTTATGEGGEPDPGLALTDEGTDAAGVLSDLPAQEASADVPVRADIADEEDNPTDAGGDDGTAETGAEASVPESAEERAEPPSEDAADEPEEAAAEPVE
jgi:hypothetical protein